MGETPTSRRRLSLTQLRAEAEARRAAARAAQTPEERLEGLRRTQAKLEENVFLAEREAARVEARYAHKLETGEATPEQVERSRRHPTTARVLAAPERRQAELDEWNAAHPELEGNDD